MVQNNASAKGVNRREQQKEHTRAAILAAAKRLFVERGYEKTNMRAVADEAGVAVGTIFLHFTDKQQLLLQTLYHDIERTLSRAFETLPQAALLDKLQHLVSVLFSYYAEHVDLSRSLLRQSMFEPGQQAVIFDEQVRRFIDAISAMLAVEIARAELPRDLNAREAAETIVATYFYVLVNGLRRNEVDANAMATQFRTFVEAQLRGFRARE